MAPVVSSDNPFGPVVTHETLVVLMGEDNPAFEGVFEFCSISAGGSICTVMVVSPRFFL